LNSTLQPYHLVEPPDLGQELSGGRPPVLRAFSSINGLDAVDDLPAIESRRCTAGEGWMPSSSTRCLIQAQPSSSSASNRRMEPMVRDG